MIDTLTLSPARLAELRAAGELAAGAGRYAVTLESGADRAVVGYANDLVAAVLTARTLHELHAEPGELIVARVAANVLEAAVLEAGVDRPTCCRVIGRSARDGRLYCRCGSLANPAGYCCESGVLIAEPGGRLAVVDGATR